MNKKILVIDDEKLITDSLQRLLRKENYEVTIANNGNEALEFIQRSSFDLIISDIRMPNLNGIEVIKKIREYLKENKQSIIPEILITGYASEENLKEAEKLNVADYIYKPFNINRFIETIKRALK
jgi:CheY-like chemotaxis protein